MDKSLQKYDTEQKIVYWAEKITECRNSGSTVRGWCAEHGINLKTYYFWQRRVYDAATFSGGKEFVQPKIVEEPSSPAIAAITVGDIRIELYRGINSESMVELIRALKQC